MVRKFTVPLLNLLIVTIASSASGQTPAPPTGTPTAPGLIKLTGDDKRRAKQLNEQIDEARERNRWDEATAKAEEVLALRTRVQGAKHFETVNAAWQLKTLRQVAAFPKDVRASFLAARDAGAAARMHKQFGDFVTAQPLYERALDSDRRVLGEDHPLTATSYDDLALNLQAQGKHAAAQPLFEKALAIRRRVLTDEHPDTTSSYNNAGYNLNVQGKFDQAQPLFEKALELRRRLLSDDHPDTATSYNNLAFNINAEGKYAQAQPLYEKALEIRRRLLSDNHSDTATSYNNLAINLNAQGKHASAQPLYAKALEIRRRLFSDDHPLTAESYNNLAINLDDLGKYAAAQPLFEKALAIRRRLFPGDHLDIAHSYESVAFNLNSQGKYAAAQPLLEKALEMQHRLLGDDHPDTAFYYNNLAYNLGHQGKYAEAHWLLEKALEIRRRLLSDNHPLTAASYDHLGMNLNAQSKYAVAQPLFEKALEIYLRVLGEEHPDTAIGYNNLAANLQHQGKDASAQLLYEKALEIKLRLLTENHPATAKGYNNVAEILYFQGKYAQAQPLFEKALEIHRRLLGDDHPDTAKGYNNAAQNLDVQGRYAAAQPLYERALELQRRLLSDNHPDTASTYGNLAANLAAQGKYHEARDRWLRAVRGRDAARLRVAFTGLERTGTMEFLHSNLAAVLARLGQPAEAWQALEEDLGRGLLDDLAARQSMRLTANERDRMRELTADLEQLDRLAESAPKDLDKTERAKQLEELKQKRDLASIALGEFQTKLVQKHGALAGNVARLEEIQAVLPDDAALIAWIDIPPVGPNAADPDGEHWGVVVRSRGVPEWVAIAGTGKDRLWNTDDTRLANRVKTALRTRSGTRASDLNLMLEKLRAQRLAPLVKALGSTRDGLPATRRIIVLPSRGIAGIPIEALLIPDDHWTVSYASSGTVFKHLREQPRPDSDAGLLALGDPVYAHADSSTNPVPQPNHGLLINAVIRGSNAANHGLKDGDVLLAYNGVAMNKKDDLKVVTDGGKPIPIEIWRDGVSSRRDLAPGRLGAMVDPRPAPEAIVENRKVQRVLAAARSGGKEFVPLPGTRREVEALARLFQSDKRFTRALLGVQASEPELDRLAITKELKQFAYIHLATHGVIDEDIPQRSAVILTQTGLADPLDEVLNHKPVFDGRLLVREIQRSWDLKAELVTLSACETALGRETGGEGFVGFTQALLMSGARSVCLSLWKVDDTATALLMTRFYRNILGKRPGLSKPMPKAEALREAKTWLQGLTRESANAAESELEHLSRSGLRREPRTPVSEHPYERPHYWAAFVLVGDPD
jgi:tetratricopeptide (TPR) repeat protein